MGEVLVVDDDEDVREELSRALVDEGYAVTTATDGEDALRKLGAMGRSPCVVLLDMMMPRMNGNEFLEKMAESEGLAQVPVVVVSAYPGKVHDRARRVIAKPLQLTTLLDAVAEYCDGGCET